MLAYDIRRFRTAGVFLVFVIQHTLLCAAPPDLNTVRAAVSFYHDSIRSMEGRFESRIVPTEKWVHRPGSLVMEDCRAFIEFRADNVHGWTRFDETESFTYSWLSKTEPMVSHSISCFDGDRPYNLTHTLVKSPIPARVPPGVPVMLGISGTDQTAPVFGPWYFAGLRFHSEPGQSLASCFQRNLVSIDGEEAVDGVNCVMISANTGFLDYKMWLDPNHDYLPRKQTYGPQGGTPGEYRTLVVLEFEQFDDGSGNLRWFPKKAVARAEQMEYPIEIVELRLNVECRKEEFRIDPESLPPGVEVVDDLKGIRSVTGGRDDLYKELKGLRDEQDGIMEAKLAASRSADTMATPSTGDGNPVRVEPRSDNWTAFFLATAGCVFVVAGLIYWKTRTR